MKTLLLTLCLAAALSYAGGKHQTREVQMPDAETPEPASVILVGGALIAGAVIASRRRK